MKVVVSVPKNVQKQNQTKSYWLRLLTRVFTAICPFYCNSLNTVNKYNQKTFIIQNLQISTNPNELYNKNEETTYAANCCTREHKDLFRPNRLLLIRVTNSPAANSSAILP